MVLRFYENMPYWCLPPWIAAMYHVTFHWNSVTFWPNTVDPHKFWIDYQYFLRHPSHVQDKVMGFFYDHEWADQLYQEIQRLPSLQAMSSLLDWQEFSKLAMIFKFDSFSFQTEEDQVIWHELFDISCRFSHSCRPNCTWTKLRTREMSIRLLTPSRRERN